MSTAVDVHVYHLLPRCSDSLSREGTGVRSCHISWPLLCQVSNDLLKASPARRSVIPDTMGDVTACKGHVSVSLCLQLALCDCPIV